MKPIGFASPGFSTLKTARLLLSALATNSSLPSGVRLRLLGVLPDGTAANRAQLIVSSGLPFCDTSSTLTAVELEQETKSVLPSGVRAISVGWLSVGQVSNLSEARSRTSMLA